MVCSSTREETVHTEMCIIQEDRSTRQNRACYLRPSGLTHLTHITSWRSSVVGDALSTDTAILLVYHRPPPSNLVLWELSLPHFTDEDSFGRKTNDFPNVTLLMSDTWDFDPCSLASIWKIHKIFDILPWIGNAHSNLVSVGSSTPSRIFPIV